MELIRSVSQATGATEDSLRLIISLLITYPIAWFYRLCLRDKNTDFKHLFFVICGVSITLFNFGYNAIHGILAVIFTYESLCILGPTKNTVIVNFVFHLSYLSIGYSLNSSESYDITWTLLHCVLVLRLIAVTFDYWDGSKDFETLSKDCKKTALARRPELLQIFAHAFFPSSFLIGPQFSLTRLNSFVYGKLETKLEPGCVSEGTKRGLIGLCYLLAFQVLNGYLPDAYLLTEEFLESSLIWKHFILGILAKKFFTKYVSCWLLAEGACITFGLAYNGVTSDNKAIWNGCRNVHLRILENATKFGHYIESFNVNTNAWAAQYIYKRMAFLGSRIISQFITLAFLALWHGLHSGYYMTFFMEFAIMVMEKQIEVILKGSEFIDSIEKSDVLRLIRYVVLKLYATIFMGYCLVPFVLYNFEKWWLIYKSLYFSGFIFFLPWAFVYKPLMTLIFKKLKGTKNID